MTEVLVDEHVARTARTVLPGVAMIGVSFGLARYGYGLLLPDMQRDLQLTSTTAGLISSAGYASYLVANVLVVVVVTRYGSRAAIGLASVSAAAGMAVVGVASSGPVLGLGVLLAGAASGFAFPPYADLVARRVRESHRDSAWSAISSGTGWGVVIAGPVAIVAGDHWRTAWLAFVVIAVLVGAWAHAWTPARTDSSVRRPQLSWSWFLCPKSRPLLVSAVVVGLGSAVFWVFGVDALREAGMSPNLARVTYAVCGAASLLGAMSGLVFRRTGLRWGYLATCALLAASLVVFAAGRAQLGSALLAAVLFGCFYNGIIAAQGIWSSRVFADHPSAGLAAVNTALTIGTLLGPVAGGLLIEAVGYAVTFVAAGSAIAVGLAFCPPGSTRRRHLEAHVCHAAPVRD